MSNENDDLNPHALDDAAKQAMLAVLDQEAEEEAAEDAEEPATASSGEDAAAGVDAGAAGAEEGGEAAGNAAAATGEAAADGEGKDGDAGAAAAAGADGKAGDGTASGEQQGGAQADDGADKPLTMEELQRQINGLKNALIEERQKNKQFKGLDLPQAPKDFSAEKKALREKWDAGDLGTDEYNEQREALTLEQARFESALTFAQLQQKAVVDQAQQSWTERVSVWEKENADFLSNPLRRKAVNDLIEEFDRDPNNRMDDDELLQRVQETAFEAFNWTRKVPHETLPQDASKEALQARQVAAARAASAAAAVPPPMTTGAGSASHSAKVQLDALVENPSKMAGARSTIDALLGDEA